MNVSVVIAAFGLLISVLTFFVGRMTAAKSDGQERGIMLTEIGYIKSGVDDMKRKIDTMDKRYIDLDRRLTAVEESVKIYHKGGGAE